MTNLFSEKILAEYAERNGYTPYQFYIDDGFSGTNERPQFKQMIEDAQKGIVKRIICKDLSRFGRDYIKVGLYTEFIFPDKDIHFIAVNDDVDSNVQKGNDLAPFRISRRTHELHCSLWLPQEFR